MLDFVVINMSAYGLTLFDAKASVGTVITELICLDTWRLNLFAVCPLRELFLVVWDSGLPNWHQYGIWQVRIFSLKVSRL